MRVDDPFLPAAPSLLGRSAREILAVAVAATGGALQDARARQVLYRPGRDLTVRYAARVRWNGAAARDETLLIGTTTSGPPAGTLPLVTEGLEVGVWRYPFDPRLPGLARSVDPHAVGTWLADHLTGPIELRVRAYRPCRRAVVHARGADGTEVYLKVVRPSRIDQLVRVHDHLRSALAVPEVLAADRERGIVALAALPGGTLRDALRRGGSPLPEPEELLGVLDAFATLDPSDLPRARRSSPLSSAAGHAALLATVLPDQAARLDRLVDEVGDDELQPTVAVHGDFHEAQLMTDGRGRITGVLDIDGSGPGSRIDDLATMVAHLTMLARSGGGRQRAMQQYAERTASAFSSGDVPDGFDVALRRRAAAVAIGLATGPFRVQARDWKRESRARVATASRLLRGAR